MAAFRVALLCCSCALLAGPSPARAQKPALRLDLSESPSGGAEAVAFSPDGKLLASVRDRGKLRLWEVATGKLAAGVDRHGGVSAFVAADGLAFSPDGKTLAVGVASGIATTGHVILWDVKGGKSLERRAALEGHAAGVRALAFTPDGKTLVSAGLDKEVRLWDVATGKTRRALRGHRERILGMALSADGKRLVTGDPGEVKVWDLDAGKEMASWEVTDLVGLALSPDGKTVAVASFPVGGITFRDVGSGRARADLKPLPGGTSPMAFSPDGKRFVSVNRDRRAVATVTLMDLAAGRDLASYNHSGGHVHVAAFSPDGKLLASGDHDTGGSARLLLMEVPGSAPRKP